MEGAKDSVSRDKTQGRNQSENGKRRVGVRGHDTCLERNEVVVVRKVAGGGSESEVVALGEVDVGHSEAQLPRPVVARV